MIRIQRQDEVRLRDEQDREYRETLEEDQRREREKKEEIHRREDEERRKEEEVVRVVNDKLDRLQNAREVLNRNGEGEPDINDKSISSIARVRLMLPSGKRVERSFRGIDTIDVVRAFLIIYFEENDIGIENFQLSSNYPKKALVDGSKTVESEGLCPQAVIMVQDLDA